MKIRIAILESDKTYLNRIVAALSNRYADKLEVYSFTDMDVALSTLNNVKADVFLADETFEIALENLPRRCGFAYLTDSSGVESIHDQRAIPKFQKIDLIYKQILSIYSENAGALSGIRANGDSAKIIAFQAPSGGCGASSMAAACAIHFATQGKRTLYLNLEKFGSSDLFFNAEGQFTMSDLIFALKSKKPNFTIKLESYVRQDPRGVYFFSSSKYALDMLELSIEDISRLLAELEVTGSYDIIILDMDFSINREALKLLRDVQTIIWVGDGSNNSNIKIMRAYESLCVMENDSDIPLMNRIVLLYNKFSNKTSRMLDEQAIRNIGGAQKFEFASQGVLLSQLASMSMFDKLN